MITPFLLAALAAPVDNSAFLESLAAANENNTTQSSSTVMVTPPVGLYDESENVEIDDLADCPIGKIQAIAADIDIIKTAVATGKTIKDATVATAFETKPDSWIKWIYLTAGALLAWLIKVGAGVCSRFKATIENVNKILKKADEAESKKDE